MRWGSRLVGGESHLFYTPVFRNTKGKGHGGDLLVELSLW